MGMIQDRPDALPAVSVRPGLGQVVERRQGVGLAATELGGHVEDGRGLDGDAREPAHGLGGEVLEAPGQVRTLEEASRVLVIPGDALFVQADVVEVDGELGGVQGLALAEVLAGGHDVEPGLQLGHGGGPVRSVLVADGSTLGRVVGWRSEGRGRWRGPPTAPIPVEDENRGRSDAGAEWSHARRELGIIDIVLSPFAGGSLR
jgi:hypothetical protein